MRIKRGAFVFVSVLVITAASAFAESPLNASAGIADNLRSLYAAKKPVTVVLKGGQSYSAKIARVGDAYVLLSELSGKEFYDALVAIDEIAAIEVRARDR
jgi:hypothetical protein